MRYRRAFLLFPVVMLLALGGVASAATLAELAARFERERGEAFQVRYKTVQAIAELGTDEAARFLAKVVTDDEDGSIRSNAAYQLARIQSPAAFKALLALWKTADRNLKASLLSAMANYRKEELPPDLLKEVLESDDQSLRSSLVRWLGRRGDARFIDEAERFLADFPNGASSLVSTLVSVKSAAAARILVRIYDETRSYDREQVPKVFGEGDAEVQQVLVDAVRSGDPDLVGRAISIAARGKVALAEPALVALLPASRGVDRAVLLEAVGAIGAKTAEGRHALLVSVSDPDEDVATSAVRALRSSPAKEAIPALIARMEKAGVGLRAEIRVTLERITGRQYGDRVDLWKKWWDEFGEEFNLDDVRKPDPDAIDTTLVNLAIDKGAAALKSVRGEDEPWKYASHPVGTTALVCLALSAAGNDLKDPDLRAGVEYLLKAPVPQQTYDLGIEAMALEAIGGKRFKRRVMECAKKILSTRNDAGFWGYPSGDGDHSNTQYAVLGLRSAARVGMRVPERTWRAIRDHFLSSRCEDGGWSYRPENRTASSSSMSAAGISSLLVCLENMKLDEGAAEELLGVIEKGYEALGERMKLDKDSLYALYGIERAGILGRKEVMAGHPWYGPGAKRLVTEQDREGFWHGQYDPAVDTSFAILFLKRFTAPISTR